MGKITKGFKYIGAGIVDLLAGGVKLFARAIGAIIKSHRKRTTESRGMCKCIVKKKKSVLFIRSTES